MLSGQRGSFYWLADPNRRLGELIASFPEVIHNKYVAITSFDSGPLALTPGELQAGWNVEGRIAYSPMVTEANEIPCDQFDEWYVFSRPTRLANVEVFVNYAGFSPVDPAELFKDERQTICGMTAGAFLSARLAERQRFWCQLEQIAPEAYLADGALLVLVTKASYCTTDYSSEYAQE